MAVKKPEPLPGADDLHEFCNLIVGLQFPRAWVRKLSLNKRRVFWAWVSNFWLRANDNNLRVIPRPVWVPKNYIYGRPGKVKF